MEKTRYYEINEEKARQSRMMFSFREYEKGSDTEAYKSRVDYAYSLCEKVPDEYKDKAEELANKYAYKMAQHINKGYEIELMCPSVMIAGPSNFPKKKKEQQNSRRETHSKEYDEIENILDQIDRLENYKPRVEKQGKARDVDFENEFFEVIQNEELNRLQLKFDGKPDDETRDVLKKNGFKWSPKNNTWQRQLTPNALYSLKFVLKKLRENQNV
jgi:hypothetical protein